MKANDSMEEGIYHCPHCGAQVPDEGRKVFIHKTFCRDNYDNFAKSNLLQKSTMESTFELVDVDLSSPPWGIRILDNPDGTVTIRYKVRSLVWPFAGVFMLFLGLAQYFADKVDESYLFMALLVLVCVYFVWTLIYCLLAKWELTVGDGQGVFKGGLGMFSRTIHFEYNSNSTVAARRLGDFGRNLMTTVQVLPDLFGTLRVMLSSMLAGHVTQRRLADLDGIILTTDGKPYCFGQTIPNDNALRYLAAYLLHVIAGA